MRRLTLFIDSALALVIGLGVLFMSCSSDDPAAPPPPDTCDEQSAGGFDISNPQPGRVYVWGGDGVPGLGDMGFAPGYTSLYWPIDVAFDPAREPIVLDWNNHRVLALDAGGNFEKIIGGGFGQPVDGPALDALLNHPTHVAFSPTGKLVLSAWHNSIVMEMDMTTGWIKKTCGTGGRCFNTKTDPDSTCLDLPVCAGFHPVTGELHFTDQGNQVIRKVDSTGQVQIVAGTAPVSNGVGGWNYQFGYTGDGGLATSAKFSFERGQMTDPAGKFCFDAAGNMYIADTNNNAIRIVHYPNGTINTFAGMGPNAAAYSGDGGLATSARLNKPRDVVWDTGGNLFIADTGNHVIRMVDASGMISTVVGVFRRPVAPYPNPDPISACSLQSEQGAPALEVHLTAPRGIELDADGNLWIADTLNNVVRIYYR